MSGTGTPANRDGDGEGRSRLREARRVVVKIGSRALVDHESRLEEDRLAALVDQMAGLRGGGREVVCVSSGAVAAGLRELGCERRPADLPTLQAAAAVGQARLMELYRRSFAAHDLVVAQVLLTHADLRARERHLNARNTLSRLLRRGVVPVINENDTVAVDEIRVGDNDLLSALVACLVRADALVLLTGADGLLTRPPGEGGRLVPRVERITHDIRAMAGGAGSDVATGGMRSKLEAVEIVTRAGERAVIANAREPDVLGRLFAGETLGTLFDPRERRLADRKRWIAFFDHPRGALHLDGGAVDAVRAGRSLLAIGIRRAEGRFDRGAPVRLLDPDGVEIGRGLVNYPSDDLDRITGLRSDAIAGVLGTCEYEEVVHRDNLAVT
ncbi:MAG: glutamate 5-kinase [Planctomycetota bacterium]|jgi:glutamate 5-kinase